MFSRVLMTRPSHFRVVYQINPWMSKEDDVDRKLAIKQWENLKETIEETGVSVEVIEQREDLPDMVFACNSGLSVGNRVYLANFRHSERQPESKVFADWFRDHGFEVVGSQSPFYFEGGGDSCFSSKDKLWAGFGYRSQLGAYDEISKLGPFKIVRCQLVDPRFYHMDTCFCVLDEHTALWYPDGFSEESQLAMRSQGVELIPVCLADAERFVCNAVAIGRTVIVPAGCDATKALLEGRGWRVVVCDMSEFLKGGGACQCLVMKLWDI